MSFATHTWEFSRIGGFDQVLIKSSDDLRHLSKLDPKLWAALSCPTKGLEFDERTLAKIDSDGDGRVREPEIKAAVAWVCEALKDPALIFTPTDTIALMDLNESSSEGAALKASALEILRTLKKTDATTINLADVEAHQKSYAKEGLNGDGFINPASTNETDLQQTLADILQAFPATKDSFGEAGVSKVELETFFALCAERLAWLQTKAQVPESPIVFDDAYASYTTVADKIDDFFSRAAVFQYQPSTATNLNAKDADWQTALSPTLSANLAEITSFPLAVVDATAAQGLPLGSNINPAWKGPIAAFRAQVVTPLFGNLLVLTLEQWQTIKAAFKPYENWLFAEKGQPVANLNQPRLQALLNSDEKARIAALIDADAALAPQATHFKLVEQLLLYRLNLAKLLRNFVNFSDFYSRDRSAIFQAGTLYLDGRACSLCIEVLDAGKHAALAGLSKCFLAYCTLTRPSGAKKDIVAAFTGGDSDYLLVGRNGVFIDRSGKDWDATITKLIENPISITQAFFAPYKRLIRFVEDQAAKKAATADASSDKLLQTSTQKATDAAQGKTPVEKPKFDVGVVAAIGVAVGGIATAFGMLLQAFFGLGYLMPLGLIGVLLVISCPSMSIAWLKLRQRNLGPLLDATGWAINGRIKINIPFGASLTEMAKLPENARRQLHDPYQEKHFPWGKLLAVVVVVAVIAVAAAYKCPKPILPWHKPSPAAVVEPTNATPPIK